jgi:hypothetical protein
MLFSNDWDDTSKFYSRTALLPRSKNLLLSFGTLWGDAIQRSDPNPYLLGHGPPAEPLVPKSRNDLQIEVLRRPSKPLTLRACIKQPRLHTFLNQGSLELGHGRNHMEHEAAGRRGQVEIIPQAHKRDAQRFKVSQQVDQVPKGSVKKAHRLAASKAGIEGRFRLYDLRHTFATRAVAAGADLPTLSALWGHTTIQMTMRYVHPAAEQKKIAIEKFERYRAEGVINAATTMAQKSHAVSTEVTTMEQIQ